MRRAVRIVRIQPDCGRARLRALSGASCSSMWSWALRCSGGGAGVSVAIDGVLACGEIYILR